MDFPLKIEITPEATPVETVSQLQYRVPNFNTKLNLLFHLLQDEATYHRVIVFVKTKQLSAFRQWSDRKSDIHFIHSPDQYASRCWCNYSNLHYPSRAKWTWVCDRKLVPNLTSISCFRSISMSACVFMMLQLNLLTSKQKTWIIADEGRISNQTRLENESARETL